MASTAKGYSGLVIENTSGIQQLLAATAVSALPASLTNATPLTNATTGMHLLIRAYNHTAAGTITVAGTAVNSLAAVSETSQSFNVPESPGQYSDYITTNVFGTVNSNGVTLGAGLTNGSVTIYGIQAAKRMLLGQFKLTDKHTEHIAVSQRGTFAQSHIPSLPLAADPEWEWEADFWPDDTSWLLFGGMNSAPTTTSIPSSGTSLLGSTSVALASTASATTQPTAPGMILAIALTGTPTTAQTVAVTGTNLWGQTITETVVPSTKTAGTWYSLNAFATIATNGIAWGAFGAGNITVTGYLGWQQSLNLGDTLNTFAAAQYDGIGSYVAPYCYVDEWTIEGGMDKEIKCTAKGKCQDILPVGNPATFTSQVPALAQPLDEAITGWRTTASIDAISSPAGTTATIDVIEFKIACANKQKTSHTSAWNPVARWFSKLDRGRREVMIELKLYMNDLATYQEYQRMFKQRQKRLIQLTIQGLNSFTNAGTAYYPGWVLNLPAVWVEDPGREFTLSQEFVTLALKGRAYLDPTLNYDLNLLATTRYQGW
jgi:hypothetical protein